MNIQHKNILIKELNRLAKGGKPEAKGMGICHNLKLAVMRYDIAFNTYFFIRNNCEDWKHFSGDSAYPVEADWIEYHTCSCKGMLWIGNNGKLRRSLCRHLVKKLKLIS